MSRAVTVVTEMGDANRAKQWLGELRRTALGIGGYAIVTAMPKAWDGIVDRWGLRAESLNPFRTLTTCWDPARILGAGTLVV